MHIPNKLREELDSIRSESIELAREEEKNGLIAINDSFSFEDLMDPNLHINCNKIVLKQGSIEIVFDAHEDISKLDSIIINGIKFVNCERGEKI